MSRTIIIDSHFHGDDHAIKLVETFCTEFLTFIKSEGLAMWANDNEVLKTFQKEIYKRTDKYQFFLVSKSPNTVEELHEHLKKTASFLHNFLSERCDMRVLFEHYLETEWSKFDHKNNYQIAQYNGMKVAYVLKVLFTNMIRDYMFRAHSSVKSSVMSAKGIDCYITSKGEINQYHVSDPEPQFSGTEEKGKHHDKLGMYGRRKGGMTKEEEWEHEISLRQGRVFTTQPDINVLKPIFEKYELVRFIDDPEVEGQFMSRFRCCDDSHMMKMLNELKYKHLNIGKKRGRMVLNIGNKNIEHRTTGDITDREITGNKWW